MSGVYLSYPFCAQKCTFCNFASGVMPRGVEDQYPSALLREIAAIPIPFHPDTVFLGGGTPSSMDLESLDRILQAIPGRPWKEATIEAAPGTIDPHRVTRWQDAGLNRISLGVQSFITSELTRTGRKHTAQTVSCDLQLLRSAGLTNINIDLIAGLPGQTSDSWNASLDRIEKLAPPHVSIYMLEVDEDSRLGKEMLLGGVRYGASDAPSDELTATFYETAVERLAAMGIPRYEISNFARPGFESLHNLKYWRREPYVGFGVDAHSFVGGRRWQNIESAVEYVRLSPDVREGPAADANEAEEKFFVGLRLSEGIEPTAEDLQLHAPAIARFLDHHLLEQSGTRLRLTPRGIMVSNEVLQEFLQA